MAKHLKHLLTLMIILAGFSASAQMDTIFTYKEKIPCSVKEITPDAVKYSLPQEEVLISIYKNTVNKIIFKSGRVQVFSEATSLKKINGPKDYENVSITGVENEIMGLFKLGQVSSKAKGTTTLSNQETIKQRAYKKLKIQAAMQGANIIYLLNQKTDGNKFGSTSEASLTGIAYSNELPNFDDFMKLIESKKSFKANYEISLWNGGRDLSETSIIKTFNIVNIKNENGLIMIEGRFFGASQNSKFRVVSFTKTNFNVFYISGNTFYNVSIKIK
jgi:hypothetical protein